MYTLYRYGQNAEELTELAKLHGAKQSDNVAEYLTDDQDKVIYFRVNDTPWQEAKGKIKLMFDDPNLKPAETLSKEEANELMFVENL